MDAGRRVNPRRTAKDGNPVKRSRVAAVLVPSAPARVYPNHVYLEPMVAEHERDFRSLLCPACGRLMLHGHAPVLMLCPFTKQMVRQVSKDDEPEAARAALEAMGRTQFVLYALELGPRDLPAEEWSTAIPEGYRDCSGQWVAGARSETIAAAQAHRVRRDGPALFIDDVLVADVQGCVDRDDFVFVDHSGDTYWPGKFTGGTRGFNSGEELKEFALTHADLLLADAARHGAKPVKATKKRAPAWQREALAAGWAPPAQER